MFALSVIAIVYTSLVAFRQTDIKKLIAYSSVAHMGFVTLGIFSGNVWGVQGAIFQMLSHGVISGALFLCVGVVYDRMHTREIAFYGGLAKRMPWYAATFMVFTMGNVGLPGTSGFVGEILTMTGSYGVATWAVFIAATGAILSAVYALTLYKRVVFGELVNPELFYHLRPRLARGGDLRAADRRARSGWASTRPPFSTTPRRRPTRSWRPSRARSPGEDAMTDLSQFTLACLPELILAIGALALLLLGAFIGERSTSAVSALAGAVLVAAAFAAALCPLGTLFNGAFVMDRTAAFAKVAIYIASAVIIVLGQGWLDRRIKAPLRVPDPGAAGRRRHEHDGLVGRPDLALHLHRADVAGALCACAFPRDDARASEAGLKYFVLGALSSGLLLYGASLVYGFTGSMRFVDIAAAVHGGATGGVIFGLVFLICGLAFKVAAAPFHMWTPDVYEGAPTPVTAFVAAAPKLAAMVLFARALAHGFFGAFDQWRQVIIAISAISYVVGAFGGLMQRDVKRLLAYSSIANMGYALLGIASGTQAGLQAMLMFMVLYIIDVTAFFACLLALVARRQADHQDRRPLRPEAGKAGHGPGHDGAVPLRARHAAVLGLLGEVLCVQGGDRGGSVAVRRGRSDRLGGRRPSTTCA